METNKHNLDKPAKHSFDFGLADKCLFCLWILLFIGLIIKGC